MKSPWFLRQCQVRSKYPIREEDHPGEFSVTLKRWTFPDSKIFYKLKMISENLLRFLGPHFWIQYFRRLLFAKCNLALHVNSSITIKKKTIWNRHYLDFDAISWAAKLEQAFGRSHSLYQMFPGRSSLLGKTHFDVAHGLTESWKDSKPIHSTYSFLVSVIISMLEKTKSFKELPWL